VSCGHLCSDPASVWHENTYTPSCGSFYYPCHSLKIDVSTPPGLYPLASNQTHLDSQTHDILIGPESPSTHLQQKYTNTIVGRYANRVPLPTSSAEDSHSPAAHTLSKAGTTSAFAPLSNESPTVSLHGGRTGFDAHVWETLPGPGAATLLTPSERAWLEAEAVGPSAAVFARTSDDGEEGYPGRLRTEVVVALVPPKGKAIDERDGGYCLGSLLVLYRAKLEEEEKVTPINLTQVCLCQRSGGMRRSCGWVALGLQSGRLASGRLGTERERTQAQDQGAFLH
jgi:hypothetical protein